MLSFHSDPRDDKHFRHISVHPALTARGRHTSNIWIFDSPKNDKRLTIQGDVAFLHVVLMEGDPNIVGYDVNPPPVYAAIDGETHKTQLDAVVYFRDGHDEWREYKRSDDIGPGRKGRARTQLSAQAQAANVEGKRYLIQTELDIKGKEFLFDNWLLLCSAITRTRNHSLHREQEILRRALNVQNAVLLNSLLKNQDADPALMMGLVARLLQSGLLITELENTLLRLDSLVSWSAS